MPNIDDIKKYKNIHMIGIAGVSMSGIAEILNHWGFTVTGSNNVQCETTERLEEHNIKVIIGHKPESVVGADLVVYTAAIKQDNPELVEAHRLGIPTMERADFLGAITKCYEDTICISGTHGKTTTTSLVSLCFVEDLKDPSIQVGADVSLLDGNYRVGNSEYFIIEACEYVESFLKFFPKSEIILNIDNDHLDYFKNFENIVKAFEKYVKLLPNDGLLVLNGDDNNCLTLKEHTNAKILTYGINNKNADFYADNIEFDNDGFAKFDVYHNSNFYESFHLHIPGLHNVLNALACITLCDSYGVSKESMVKVLSIFSGASRRFEFKGKVNGASIYDDYGHHPTEVLATAKALQSKKYNESWVVFQPHTYSRTKNHLDDFAKALLGFDNILILDVYAARETNTYGVTSEDLVNKIKEYGKDAKYIHNFDECLSMIKENAKENDIILTLGAGTVTQIGPMLIK